MPLVPDLITTAALSLLGFGVPAAALPAPADTVSVYVGRISGAIFDDPFDVRVQVAFERDGRFRMTALVQAEGKTERDSIEGTWRRDGRRIVLRTSGGDEQAFHRRGDRLVFDTEWPLTALRVLLGLPEIDLHLRDGRTL